MINPSYTYLLIDFFTMLFPFIFSFHKKWKFKSEWKPFFKANAIVLIAFVAWDVVFTYLQVWSFNPRYLSGIYLINLPVEEILFFICIPYACVFSYYCFGIWKGEAFAGRKSYILSAVLATALIVVAVMHHDRYYTFYNLLATAIFIVYAGLIKKKAWITQLYVTYAVMLLPFFVVNGLLTGTGLQEAIVRYNTAHILNIRLLTIPIEDAFYGFLLVGLNVYLYEFFRHKKS